MGDVVGRGVGSGAGSSPSSVMSRVREFRSWVAGLDGADLLDAERIGLVAELERVKGASTAAQARVTVRLAESQLGDETGSGRVRQGREDAVARRRSLGSQIALARRDSPSWGDRFVGVSQALVNELPFTMEALAGGAIGERHAVAMVRETACLTVEDRAEVDRRVGPVLGGLGVKGVAGAARRVAAELDAASVVARMESAVGSRRVTVRPAPDGMAYLTVLGPLRDVVGAHAALRARA
ncbi:MAG: HNH endonuclease, partial [Ornithinibacter sp.]